MTDHHAERFRQITEVLARHGLGFGIGAAGLHRWLPVEHGLLGHEQREEPYTNPEHLRLALEQLGPVFVKFGQVLSTRADLLPEPYREQLSRLQDSAPPVPGPVITELIAGELGHAPSEVFAAFEETPLASASLGQAHAARLADGTEVVVKVRRPEVAAQVQEDLEILQNVAARASRYWEAAADYDVTGIAEEFAVTLRAELDYLAEGRNAERFAANFAGNDDIRIPRVFWETTTSRVLTLERMHGLKISDLAGLEAAGIDRAALASRAAGAVAQMVFRDGFFHADPHPGNLFVEPGGRIALIDFGMVGDIDEHLRARLGALLLALVRQNPRRIATALAQLTTSRHPVNIPALAGDLAPVVALYSGRPLGEIPVGGLIKEVHAVLRRHHLQLPREFSLLLKMLLMAEGVGTMLDPRFQLGEVLRPYAHGLVLERYSPSAIAGRLSQAGTDVLDLTAELPEQLRRVQAMLEAGGPELHLRTAELDPLVDRLESAGHRLGLAILAAAFVRGLGDLAASDPVRRRSWQLPVLSTGLGATGSLGAYLAWSAHRQRRRRP